MSDNSKEDSKPTTPQHINHHDDIIKVSISMDSFFISF